LVYIAISISKVQRVLLWVIPNRGYLCESGRAKRE